MGNARATEVAAAIGQGFAVVFGIVGIFYNPMLLIIAVFIFLAASGEARALAASRFGASWPLSRTTPSVGSSSRFSRRKTYPIHSDQPRQEFHRHALGR